MIYLDWDLQVQTDPDIRAGMNAAAEAAVCREGIRLPCAVHICLCDDHLIAEINEKYRGIAASTDVLSFPSVSYPAGKTAGSCEPLLRLEFDDEARACFLGDLFISVPHMLRQAEEYGHSALREGCYLMVHGLCHLMGYDHIQEEERNRMRAMEEQILSSVNITRFPASKE